MQKARRQGRRPFGVPVEGRVVNDVVMVQQAFGVSLAYQDITFRERLRPCASASRCWLSWSRGDRQDRRRERSA